MRVLQSIVGVQGIALLVMLAIWLQRGDVAAPTTMTADELPAANRASPTEGALASDATVAARPVERTNADTVAGTVASHQTVILQGRLTGMTPLPDTDSVVLYVLQGTRRHFADVTKSGAYAIPGLAPGTWTMQCQANGCRQMKFEHTLDHRPIQRLDIELQPATVLKVFVRTSDGARLQTELGKLGLWQVVRVIATESPLSSDLMSTDQGSVGDVGIGRHRQLSDRNQRLDPNADDGVLELDQPPPANAALLVRHMVLAQQTIAIGQTELRFEVDMATVQARFATVRLRVVDALGQPMPGARIDLSSAPGGGQRDRADEQGECTIANVLPGLASFSIVARDAERYATHLTIAPGANLDLGDIKLTAPSEASGLVITSDGKPTAATVRWSPLDLWRAPHPMRNDQIVAVDADGLCQLHGAGRRRYSVVASTKDHQVGFAIVDANSAERFTITVHPTQTVRIQLTHRVQGRAVVITDQLGNVLQVCHIDSRRPTRSVALPNGDYRMLVYNGLGAQLLSEPLHVDGETIEKVLP